MLNKVKNLAVFFCFLPYLFFFIKTPGQVQAWAHVLAGLTLILNFKGVVSFRRKELPLIFGGILFFLLPYSFNTYVYSVIVQKASGFLLGLFVFYMAKTIEFKSCGPLLFVASILYFLVGLVQIFSTSLYLTLGEIFFSTRHAVIGDRGVSSIAPEATDLGFTVAFLLFVSFLWLREYGSNRFVLFAAFGFFILLFMSASAAGFFVLVATFAPLILSARLPLGVRVIGVASTLIVVFTVDGIRGIDLLQSLVFDPTALLNTSLAHRLGHNYVAFAALFETGGLGYGGGAFVHEAPRLFDYLGVGMLLNFNGHYQSAVGDTLGNHALSMTSLLIFEYGLIGLAYILSAAYLIVSSKSPYNVSVLVLFLCTWGQSFPSAYPLLWLVMGLLYNPKCPRLSGIGNSANG